LVLLFLRVDQGRRIYLFPKKLVTTVMNQTNTQVQMRKGLLEYCVLHIISRGEVYTSDLIEELTQAQMIVVEGTLYPLLNRLKSAALVSYRWVESEAGPPRKYYSITEEGQATLKSLAQTWKALVQSINQITKKK
jgi:PadR family transcriptional regulator, regulatory protein PadR